MVAQATTISQLPVQLLARILAVLEPAERLGSAALVATAWRTAAVLGTDDIQLNVMEMSEEVPRRFDSLSAWLATNSYAGITELNALMPMPKNPVLQANQQMPVLQFPSLQRLPGLECLLCYGLTITARQANSGAGAEAAGEQVADAPEAANAADPADAAQAGGPPPLLPLELSPATALTALQLYTCDVTVQGLAALTRLQSLTLGAPTYCHLPQTVASDLSTELQQALPQLQALEFLRLFGEVAHDDVLQHVSSLLRLQELVLVDGMFTPASFQQLPQSLTHLSIDWAAGNTASHTLTASTAPGVSTLTALQDLDLCLGAISLDLLATLTSLKMLVLGRGDLEGPGTLSVLTALTQLTYLVLPPLGAALLPTDEDAAAITASTKLVVLDLVSTYLDASTCKHIFPTGRRLLELTKLSVSLSQVHHANEAARVASCCPNLESLWFGPSLNDDWLAGANPALVSAGVYSMVMCWQRLQHLTSLTLDMQDLPMLLEVWHGLARLTQLQELKVNINKLEYLAGVLSLTRCTRLKSLCVDARSLEGMMDRVWLDVTGEEGADGTTDLAQQLPKALQQSILQQVSEDNGTPELLAVLARCAADVQQAQEQQLAQQQGKIAQQQREIGQLREEIAQQQGETSQQQGVVDELRRELRGVQASLAAVLQQLQGQAGAGTS